MKEYKILVAKNPEGIEREINELSKTYSVEVKGGVFVTSDLDGYTFFQAIIIETV